MNTVLRDLPGRKSIPDGNSCTVFTLSLFVFWSDFCLGYTFYKTPYIIPIHSTFLLFCCSCFVFCFMFFEVSLLATHRFVYQCPTKCHLITYFLSDFTRNLLYYRHLWILYTSYKLLQTLLKLYNSVSCYHRVISRSIYVRDRGTADPQVYWPRKGRKCQWFMGWFGLFLWLMGQGTHRPMLQEKEKGGKGEG